MQAMKTSFISSKFLLYRNIITPDHCLQMYLKQELLSKKSTSLGSERTDVGIIAHVSLFEAVCGGSHVNEVHL